MEKTHLLSDEDMKAEWGFALRACPFCYGKVSLLYHKSLNAETSYGEGGNFQIYCPSCKFMTVEMDEDIIKEKLETFNRRPSYPRVQITDREALEAVELDQMKVYLKNKGWIAYDERVSDEWVKDRKCLFVPSEKSKGMNQHLENIRDNIRILAGLENRSQLDIYYDIVGGGG